MEIQGVFVILSTLDVDCLNLTGASKYIDDPKVRAIPAMVEILGSEA